MRKMSTKLSQIKVLFPGGADIYQTPVIFITVSYSKKVNFSSRKSHTSGFLDQTTLWYIVAMIFRSVQTLFKDGLWVVP